MSISPVNKRYDTINSPNARRVSSSSSTESFITVCVRIRPSNSKELQNGQIECFQCNSNGISIDEYDIEHVKTDEDIPIIKTWNFDHVFGPDSTNETIFKTAAIPIIDSALQGYNGVLFMYGQTSSGKTHTLFGDDSEIGIVEDTLEYLQNKLITSEDTEYVVKISYAELYNEELKDLLSIQPNNEQLKIVDDPIIGPCIQGITDVIFTTAAEAKDLLIEGELRRHFGITTWNIHSSRSHVLVRIHIESRKVSAKPINSLRSNWGKDRPTSYSILNLVDLAGSERASRSTSLRRESLKESGYINKSLLTLGNVIACLSDGNTQHIPYRNSKLTRLLASALGGNARTCMISCISPNALNIAESLNTLRFSTRAKNIVNTIHINELTTQGSLPLSNLKQKLIDQEKEISYFKNKYKKLSSSYVNLSLSSQKIKIIYCLLPIVVKELVCINRYDLCSQLKDHVLGMILDLVEINNVIELLNHLIFIYLSNNQKLVYIISTLINNIDINIDEGYSGYDIESIDRTKTDGLSDNTSIDSLFNLPIISFSNDNMISIHSTNVSNQLFSNNDFKLSIDEIFESLDYDINILNEKLENSLMNIEDMSNKSLDSEIRLCDNVNDLIVQLDSCFGFIDYIDRATYDKNKQLMNLNNSSRDIISIVNNVNRTLKSDNYDLSCQLIDQRNHNFNLLDEVSRYCIDQIIDTIITNELSDNINILMNNNYQLNSIVESNLDNYIHVNNQLNDEIENSNMISNTLNNQLVDRSKENEDLSIKLMTIENQYNNLCNDMKQLNSLLDIEINKNIDLNNYCIELNSKINDLIHKQDNLSDINSNQSIQIIDLNNSMNSYKNSIDKYQLIINELNIQLEDEKSINIRLNNEVSTLTSNLSYITNDQIKVSESIRSIENEKSDTLKQLQDVNILLDSEKELVNRLNHKLSTLSIDFNNKLDNIRTNSVNLSNQLNAIQIEKSELIVLIDKLNNDLTNERSNHQSIQNDLQVNISNYRELNDQLNNQVSTNKKHIKDLEDTVSISEQKILLLLDKLDEMNQQLIIVNDQLSNLQIEKVELVDKIDELINTQTDSTANYSSIIEKKDEQLTELNNLVNLLGIQKDHESERVIFCIHLVSLLYDHLSSEEIKIVDIQTNLKIELDIETQLVHYLSNQNRFLNKSLIIQIDKCKNIYEDNKNLSNQLNEERANRNTTIEDLTNLLSISNDKLISYENEIIELSNQLNDLTLKLSDKDIEINSLTNSSKKLELETISLSKQLIDITSNLYDDKEKYKHYINQSNGTVDNLNKQINDLTNQLNTLDNKYKNDAQRMNEQIYEMTNEITSNKSFITALELENSNKTIHIETLNLKINDLTDQLNILDSKYTNDINDKNNEIKMLLKEYDNQKSIINTLESNNNNQSLSINQLNAIVNEQTIRLNTLDSTYKKELNEKNNIVKDLIAELDDQKSNISKLENINISNMLKISGLNDCIVDLKGQVNISNQKYVNDINEYKQQINDLNKVIDNLKSNINDHESNYRNMSIEMSKLNDVISDISNQLKQLDIKYITDITEKKNEINRLISDFDDHNLLIDGLKSDNETKSLKIDELSFQLNTLKSSYKEDISNKTQQINELLEDVESAKAVMHDFETTNQYNIEKLKEHIDDLTIQLNLLDCKYVNDINDKNHQITDLKDELNNLQSINTTHLSHIEKLNDIIYGQTTRLKAFEEKFTNEIDENNNQILELKRELDYSKSSINSLASSNNLKSKQIVDYLKYFNKVNEFIKYENKSLLVGDSNEDIDHKSSNKLDEVIDNNLDSRLESKKGSYILSNDIDSYMISTDITTKSSITITNPIDNSSQCIVYYIYDDNYIHIESSLFDVLLTNYNILQSDNVLLKEYLDIYEKERKDLLSKYLNSNPSNKITLH